MSDIFVDFDLHLKTENEAVSFKDKLSRLEKDSQHDLAKMFYLATGSKEDLEYPDLSVDKISKRKNVVKIKAYGGLLDSPVVPEWLNKALSNLGVEKMKVKEKGDDDCESEIISYFLGEERVNLKEFKAGVLSEKRPIDEAVISKYHEVIEKLKELQLKVVKRIAELKDFGCEDMLLEDHSFRLLDDYISSRNPSPIIVELISKVIEKELDLAAAHTEIKDIAEAYFSLVCLVGSTFEYSLAEYGEEDAICGLKQNLNRKI